MASDLEALRTECNAQGISCRGKNGGYLHRSTLIRKMSGGARRHVAPLAPLVFKHSKLLYSWKLDGSQLDIKNSINTAIMQTMPHIIGDVVVDAQYGAPLPNGHNPTIVNVRLYNHPELSHQDTQHVHGAIHDALAPYRLHQDGGAKRPLAPPLPHSTIAGSYLFTGNQTQVYNIARTALTQERQAFPQTVAGDWKIDIHGAAPDIDGSHPSVLTVRLQNHPEITGHMLQPLSMSIRNALLPYIKQYGGAKRPLATSS
jgi:hypothetical protein